MLSGDYPLYLSQSETGGGSSGGYPYTSESVGDLYRASSEGYPLYLWQSGDWGGSSESEPTMDQSEEEAVEYNCTLCKKVRVRTPYTLSQSDHWGRVESPGYPPIQMVPYTPTRSETGPRFTVGIKKIGSNRSPVTLSFDLVSSAGKKKPWFHRS